MITVNINCSRIDKTALFDGKNGKYLNLVLWENREGLDKFGNTGFVTQDIGKERRDAGEKGAILGNYKVVGESKSGLPPRTQPEDKGGDDDIPW